MDVWITTVVPALAASAITGALTFSAGAWQAKAARYAGARQAEALVETMRMQLAQERTLRMLDSRRKTYLDFIAAVRAVITARRSGEGPADGRVALQQALDAVQVEGPPETFQAAKDVFDCLRGTGQSPDDHERALKKFIVAVREALGITEREV